MPDGIETYVHRIGRTGRAGREGTAITFVTPGEMHKLRRLEQGLHVKIEELDVPSDADIARAEQRDLRVALEEAAQGDLSAAREWAKGVAASAGADVATLGAAALQLLSERDGVSLGAIPKEGPPSWAVTRNKREPRPTRFPPREDETFLFFPVGFKRGVKPADLVGMLANEAQVEVGRIGRITVLANKSFVGLPKDVAEHVLKVLPSVTIRGTAVPIRPAHDRPEQERRPRPGGTPDRAPSPRASGPGHHKSRAPKKYKPKPKPHLGKRNFKKKSRP
jgi:ATP-dependent RNA helicase DeaD